MFDAPDQLYCGLDRVYYPSRPIIVLIFEDDEHIKEVWGALRSVLTEAPQQEIWLTTDLRTFNSSNNEGRFLVDKDGEFVHVDHVGLFGKERIDPDAETEEGSDEE